MNSKTGLMANVGVLKIFDNVVPHFSVSESPDCFERFRLLNRFLPDRE